MNSLLSSPAFVGAIAGAVAVVVLFRFVVKKQFKVGAGRKMGVNLSAGLACPKCAAPFPTLRIPRNYRQFMWGGWTCSRCGGEFDKWLLPVPKTK